MTPVAGGNTGVPLRVGPRVGGGARHSPTPQSAAAPSSLSSTHSSECRGTSPGFEPLMKGIFIH